MKKTITILLFLCMMFNTIIFADTAPQPLTFIHLVLVQMLMPLPMSTQL